MLTCTVRVARIHGVLCRVLRSFPETYVQAKLPQKMPPLQPEFSLEELLGTLQSVLLARPTWLMIFAGLFVRAAMGKMTAFMQKAVSPLLQRVSPSQLKFLLTCGC